MGWILGRDNAGCRLWQLRWCDWYDDGDLSGTAVDKPVRETGRVFVVTTDGGRRVWVPRHWWTDGGVRASGRLIELTASLNHTIRDGVSVYCADRD